MLKGVARMFAQSNAVGWIVPKRRVFSPGFDVVRVEPTATVAASLAGPIVALKHGGTESLVSWILEISIAKRARAALPVWVCCTDKMAVSRRDTAGAFRSSSDSCPMCWRERLPFKRLTDGGNRLGSRGWRHQLNLPVGRLRLRCDLRSNLWPFGNIIDQVLSCHFAGVSAEAFSSSAILFTALFTGSHL